MVFRTIAALCFVVALAWSDATAAVTAEDIAATAAWFDSLDLLPDLHDKPYVEVVSGKTWTNATDVKIYWESGFLQAEDEKNYTLFSDGTTRTLGWERDFWRFGMKQYPKQWEDAKDVDLGPVRKIDLAAVVDEAIAEAQKPDPGMGTGFLRRSPSDRTALFLLARCCARQGRADLAKKLDAALLDLATKPTNDSRADEIPFRTFVEKDIAHSLMWRAMVEIGKPAIPRSELLAQFERIARDFPASEHHEKAASYAATLRTMIAEDEAHAASAKPVAQMNRDEQVQEWVFRLRDQHGEQMGEPGGVALLEWTIPPGTEPSPGMHLVQLGYAAVPALIAALDDQRLTRSVQGIFYFPRYPLTVEDCARTILSRISGLHFRGGNGQEPDRAGIMEWWRETEAKGEKAMLVKNVSLAIEQCDPQIQRLIELDPAAAVEALQHGIGNSRVDGVQAQMIARLGTIKSTAATKLLRGELKTCSSLQGRVAAAKALWQRGEKDVVPVMIAEWKRWDGVARLDQQGGIARAHYEYPDTLIAFLSHCGDATAMKALAAHVGTLSAADKIKVLGWATGTQSRFGSPPADEARIPAKASVVAEQLAISALEDQSTVSGVTLEGASFKAPRVCDLAAYALAKTWPQRYAFAWVESPYARDVQITQLRNAWRQAHGQKPL